MDTGARSLALLSVLLNALLLCLQVEPFSLRTPRPPVGVRQTLSTDLTLSTGDSERPSVGDSGVLRIEGSPNGEDFIPTNISKAAALGCVVAGDKGPPPYVEVQVFVKTTTDDSNWDYRPKVARYPMGAAGIYKALDECANWYRLVKQRMAQEAERGEQAH